MSMMPSSLTPQGPAASAFRPLCSRLTCSRLTCSRLTGSRSAVDPPSQGSSVPSEGRSWLQWRGGPEPPSVE